MHSAVLILPVHLREQGDQVGEIMGWGPVSYTIPLSEDNMTITHYGLRADVSEQFMDWIVTQTNLPNIPNLSTVLDNLIYDFSGVDHNLWGRDHLDHVCTHNNLVIKE